MSAGGGSSPSRRLLRLALPVTVSICAALLFWVQFSFDGLYDGDSYFHTRAARELAEHGPRRQFPQASVSTWSERYSDKDFLYHVLLIPFQADPQAEEDLVTAGKNAAAFFDLVLLAAVALSLRLVGARFPVLWILLLFSTNVDVLGHLLAVRPHVLGIALLVLEAALLVRRSVLLVGILSVLHVLAHSSFMLVPGLAGALIVACLLRREPVPWRSAAAVAAGLAAGNLFHPYFPANLTLTWDQTVEVARNVWGASSAIPPDLFGSELRPATTEDFLSCFPGWAPAAAGLTAFLALTRARVLSTETLGLLVMSSVLGVLAFLSATFIAFFIPVAILLAGRVWTELAGDRSFRGLWIERRRELILSAGVLLSCLAAGQYSASPLRLQHKAQRMPTRSAERPAVEFLRQHAAPEDLVYHNFWWDFSVLYHYRPEGRYIVALDPVFMYRYDPERFRAMLSAYRGQARSVHEIISEQFGARWVYVSRSSRYQPFLGLLQSDWRFERVYSDEHAEVYRLRE